MITPERIAQITQVIEKAGLNEGTLSALRETFTDIHFTHCMEEDIGTGIGISEPVREASGFNLYLVDGRSHCMRFTTNAEVATGLVLAETDDGD